eukprot:scaffold13502_cov109-Isochrysis_galbana.AAC.1
MVRNAVGVGEAGRGSGRNGGGSCPALAGVAVRGMPRASVAANTAAIEPNIAACPPINESVVRNGVGPGFSIHADSKAPMQAPTPAPTAP